MYLSEREDFTEKRLRWVLDSFSCFTHIGLSLLFLFCKNWGEMSCTIFSLIVGNTPLPLCVCVCLSLRVILGVRYQFPHCTNPDAEAKLAPTPMTALGGAVVTWGKAVSPDHRA